MQLKVSENNFGSKGNCKIKLDTRFSKISKLLPSTTVIKFSLKLPMAQINGSITASTLAITYKSNSLLSLLKNKENFKNTSRVTLNNNKS